jgi:hypothetical protein
LRTWRGTDARPCSGESLVRTADGGESPALRLTRYFCDRGLEQATAAMRPFLLVEIHFP